MRTQFITIAFVVAVSATALSYLAATGGEHPSTETENEFAQAKHEFSEAKYSESIIRLKRLIEGGEQSAAIYHNLALAHHRAQNLGEAILNYERAARLEPGAADIRANLNRARKEAAVPDLPAPALQRISSQLPAERWGAIAATGGFALGLLALGCATRLLAWPKTATRLVAAGALIAIAIPICAIAINRHAEAVRIIVTTDNASLRISPFENAKSLGSLAPGMALRILDEPAHGEYRLVQLETGKKGWLMATDFASPSDPITK